MLKCENKDFASFHSCFHLAPCCPKESKDAPTPKSITLAPSACEVCSTWIDRCNRSTISAQERINFFTFIRALAEHRRKRPVGKDRIWDFFPMKRSLHSSILFWSKTVRIFLLRLLPVSSVMYILYTYGSDFLLQYDYSLFYLNFIQKGRQNEEGARKRSRPSSHSREPSSPRSVPSRQCSPARQLGMPSSTHSASQRHGGFKRCAGINFFLCSSWQSSDINFLVGRLSSVLILLLQVRRETFYTPLGHLQCRRRRHL